MRSYDGGTPGRRPRFGAWRWCFGAAALITCWGGVARAADVAGPAPLAPPAPSAGSPITAAPGTANPSPAPPANTPPAPPAATPAPPSATPGVAQPPAPSAPVAAAPAAAPATPPPSAAPAPVPPAAAPSPSPSAEDFLVWQAPAGCSTADAVKARVSELLGQPQLELKDVRRVEGRVTETFGGWTLELTVVDALGTRERVLTAEQCSDLAEAAAVAITLAFEAARSRAESAAIQLTPPPATHEPPPDAPLPEDADQTQETARGAIGLELVLDPTTLPSAVIGPSLSAALRWPNVRLGIYAMWLPDGKMTVAPSQGIEMSLLGGGARACYTIGHGIVDTAACAGFEAGRLSARGAGLAGAQTVTDLWLAPQLGLELSPRVTDTLALFARADLVVPLLRQKYAVNETQDVYELSSVGARVALGAVVTF